MNDFLFQPFSKFVKLSDFSHKLIKKCCGGDRVIDVLLHFPSSIIRRTDDIQNFSERDRLTVVIKVTDHVIPSYKNSPYRIVGQTPNGEIITVVYFNYNRHFIKKTFPYDAVLTVSGPAQRKTDGIEITHPDIIASPGMAKYYVGTEAVYPLVSKLTNKTLSYVVKYLLKSLPNIPEWIPAEFIEKYHLMSFAEALKEIHFPKNLNDIESSAAKKRIAIDELLANQIRLKELRNLLTSHTVPIFHKTNEIISRLKLPFQLTDDQLACLSDIEKDFAAGTPMNRLLQGDVGSGKTVVAFISMLIAIENNTQVAMLAPTEILARQHFDTIRKLSEGLNLNIDIMLSSNRKLRKLQIEKLKNGETDILLGTHAIIEDNIEFKNLGLAVIDEQHRFGVQQRLTLIKKCKYPHVLSMSATPIPRTLLLGCFGDLDVSTIKTKPSGRKPISTSVISVSKVHELISKLVTVDSQIYWVCPVIEESESLVDVNTRCDSLRQAFSENDVQILHGKMKPKEKEDIMARFKAGEFKLLVSTTVIEVGVDIPNANVMVIEHAERFGLAQLHQLRGRIGRGDKPSYCVLLYHFPVSVVGKQRLSLMRETTDGFLLSEEDLKLRGAGDILGKEQSGFDTLRFSDFSDNYELVQIADEIAQKAAPNDILYKIFKRQNDDVIA